MCFFYLLLLYVFCACFEGDHGVAAEGGIVKQYLEDGGTPVNTNPLKTLSLDNHLQYLECFYEHKFESITGTTDENGSKLKHRSQHRHGFFLQCIKMEPSQDAYLFVFFNALPIDRLTVTSCDKYAVQQSIFPPRPDHVMKERYSQVYNYDNLFLTPHLVYKDVSGQCYQRMYKVDYDKRLGRFELKDRKGMDSVGRAECGYVEFSCRAPSTEVKSTVIAIADPDRTVPLALALTNEPGTTKQLVCTVPLAGPKTSDYSYELICVKTQKKPETQEDEESSGDTFFAFVNYGSSNAFPLVKFTVKSCIEDDIVNSIFPDRLERPGSMFPRIQFKYYDGKCYEQLYRAQEPFEEEQERQYRVKLDLEIDCPRDPLGWVHPYMRTGSVMWLSCQGPTSASGEPKTLP